MADIMQYFPLEKARKSQEIVIKEIDKVFSTGKKIVILEAPVGSGKSAIALTLAKAQAANPRKELAEGETELPMPVHIITPRKSLQDQYFADFPKDLVTMKGRNSYPCISELSPREYIPIIKAIQAGKSTTLSPGQPSCSGAPCEGDGDFYKMCVESHPCPYDLATDVAQQSSVIVHNLHSFIYQTSFATKFKKRSLLIIDEAHEIENTIRAFSTRTFNTKAKLERKDVEKLKTVKDLTDFLLKSGVVPEQTKEDLAKAAADPKYRSPYTVFQEQVASLEKASMMFDKGYSIEVIPAENIITKVRTGTRLEIVPHYIGPDVKRLLLNFADKVLLMSGTIYDKKSYCGQLGINVEDAHFIRIDSGFPVENRPIYLKPEYQVDTSHAKWDQNFDKMIEIVKRILGIFHDAKGLIHAPSYYAARQISEALKDPRIWTHEPNTFLSTLDAFFKSSGNPVLISPVCQQGVDFKGDRARFQIVLRVPYMNVSSAFVADKRERDFAWYNYQSLIVFGQQVGRVNRAPDDYGATFLLDARFHAFIAKNRKVLPKWLLEGFISK